MKNDLETGTPLETFVTIGAYVGAPIGAIGGAVVWFYRIPNFGKDGFGPLVHGFFSLLLVPVGAMYGSILGLVCGACLGLVLWLVLWLLRKIRQR